MTVTSIREIREEADRIPDPEMRNACLEIIQQVSERTKKNGRKSWTFQIISEWIHRPPEDPVTFRSIQFLASSNNSRLLEMHFIFFDPSTPDDPGEEIDDQEVIEAYSSGFLVHPISGRELHDFERMLAPYFTPCADLAQA